MENLLIWEARSKNSTSLNMSKSVPGKEVTNPSKDLDLTQSGKDKELVSLDPTLLKEKDILNSSLINLSLGKKVGRPRRNKKMYSFGEFKKAGNRRSSQASAQVRKFNFNSSKIIRSSGKESRKRIRLKKLQEVEERISDLREEGGPSKDLVIEVLETGEMMGLVLYEDRESALKKI